MLERCVGCEVDVLGPADYCSQSAYDLASRRNVMKAIRSLVQYHDTVPPLALVAVGILLSACSDVAPPAPTAPSVQASFALQGPEPRRTDTPWRRMTDTELAGQIERAGGRVFIGFKDENAAAGVDPAGRVLASRSAIAAGKAAIRAMGVEFEMEFIDMPTVVARMSAARLPELRRNPLSFRVAKLHRRTVWMHSDTVPRWLALPPRWTIRSRS